MLRRLTCVCGLVVASAAVISGPVVAEASAAPHSVIGVFTTQDGNVNAYDAVTGGGPRAQGTAYGQLINPGSPFAPGGVYQLDRVTCLKVRVDAAGVTHATIGTKKLSSNVDRGSFIYGEYQIIDNQPTPFGGTQDYVGGGFLERPSTCPVDLNPANPPNPGYLAIAAGDLIVQ